MLLQISPNHYNCIDAATFDGYVLRIDCRKVEEGLKATPCSECALNALAIDKPLEYATLYLDGCMQIWVDAEDLLKLCYLYGGLVKI